jgi:hypothetical protein
LPFGDLARSDVVVAAVAVGQTALFAALFGAFIWLTLSGLRRGQPATAAAPT